MEVEEKQKHEIHDQTIKAQPSGKRDLLQRHPSARLSPKGFAEAERKCPQPLEDAEERELKGSTAAAECSIQAEVIAIGAAQR